MLLKLDRGKLALLTAFLFVLGLLLYRQEIAKSSKLALSADSRKVKQNVLRFVPVGSRLSDARKFMEMNAFACSISNRPAFAEGDAKHAGFHTVRAKNFLSCEKRAGHSFGFAADHWEINFTYTSERVTGVYVLYESLVV